MPTRNYRRSCRSQQQFFSSTRSYGQTLVRRTIGTDRVPGGVGLDGGWGGELKLLSCPPYGISKVIHAVLSRYNLAHVNTPT